MMQSPVTAHSIDLPAEQARLHSWLEDGFGADAARQLEQTPALPRYRPGFVLAALLHTTIVGAALLRHERRRLHAATLDVGVVTLFVSPDHQAAVREALVGEVARVLAEQAIPLLLIHDRAEPFAVWGCAPVAFRSVVLLDSAVAATIGTPPGYDLRQAAQPSAADLDDLAALHAANYDRLDLSLVRAAPDWRTWLSVQPDVLMIEDRQGRLGGYACIASGAGEQALQIVEAAAADAGAAQALLAVVAERATSETMPALALHLSPYHPVARTAVIHGGELRLSAPDPDEGTVLAGVVDLALLLEALQPALAEQLAHSRYAGWNGSLRIETTAERATIIVAAGAITVDTETTMVDLRVRNVALPALAQLCLGYRTAADLRASGALACDDSALGLIDTLFPARYATES